MLLSHFIDSLSQESPHLYSTLNLHEFIGFAVLAAEVSKRAKGSPRYEAATVTPFIRASLNLTLPTVLCNTLWDILSPLLPQLNVDAARLIRENSYLPHLPVQMPEFTLIAPFKQCLLCTTAHTNLHHRSRLDGYLYDLDGVHTVAVVTLKCPSKISFSSVLQRPDIDCFCGR